MNDIDEIRRRMEKRRAHRHPVLTDRHFSKIYNGMIKAMVALIAGALRTEKTLAAQKFLEKYKYTYL